MISESSSPDTSNEALSVSAALSIAKGELESIVVRIVGEVSEVSNKPGYKAVYFTIKDEKSSLPCMIWKNRFDAASVDLQLGSLVEISGRFSLYAAKGRMNFDVFSLSLAGEGRLRMQVAELAKRLRAEGLMDATRKRGLPRLPRRIGLVTSPRGAAVHDVLRTLRRRYPLAKILLAGVPVEGPGAPSNLIAGMQSVAEAGAEVVLLVRGGGSFEDLMPFNDESLARAIAFMPVPVVTGIGHEPDTSIADMVADVRASTPTAAAEAVSSSMEEINTYLDALSIRANRSVSSSLEKYAFKLNRISTSQLFSSPMRLFEEEARALDDISFRIAAAIPSMLDKEKEKLRFSAYVLESNLRQMTDKYESEININELSFKRIGTTLLDRFVEWISLNGSRLEDLSPLKTIARGYSIARFSDGGIIRSVDQVASGDQVDIVVEDGFIHCSVNASEKASFVLDNIFERGV